MNSYATPGTTPLYSSPAYSMSSLGLDSFTQGTTLNMAQSDLNGGVVVPQDFTWTVTFGNIPAGEAAGLALYSPPTVGENFDDAWVNTGTSENPNWSLDVSDPGNPGLQFGAEIQTVPEPSTTALCLIGAGVFMAARLRRR